MPKLIDHDRIAKMAWLGIPDNVIAHRLRVSQRTVRRVREARNMNPGRLDIFGTDDEKGVWEDMKSLGWSQADIAYLVGLTRQAIHNYFSQPRQVEGAPYDWE